MKLEGVLAQIRSEKCACFCYEKTARGRFRDRVTVFCDGRLLFERYCYGEAAGRVCAMWAPGADEEGRVAWAYDECPYSGRGEAPRQLTGAGDGALVFDGEPAVWTCAEKRRTDAANGYGRLTMLWRRLRPAR